MLVKVREQLLRSGKGSIEMKLLDKVESFLHQMIVERKRGTGGEGKTARTATKVCLMTWGDVTQNDSGMAEASE